MAYSMQPVLWAVYLIVCWLHITRDLEVCHVRRASPPTSCYFVLKKGRLQHRAVCPCISDRQSKKELHLHWMPSKRDPDLDGALNATDDISFSDALHSSLFLFSSRDTIKHSVKGPHFACFERPVASEARDML